MPFSDTIRREALVRSRRHCCVCQEFAGRNAQVHHITPEADGGDDTIENAVVLCLRCHAEAGHYNPRHPIGNKYSAAEIRRHRDEWWQVCSTSGAKIPEKSPITVTPMEIRLMPSEWNQKTSILIHNRSSQPFFQVWVQLTLSKGLLFGTNVLIEPIAPSDASSLTSANLTVAGSMLGMSGHDNTGAPAQLFRVYGIDPGKTFRMNVTTKVPLSHSVLGGRLSIQLVDYSDEPPMLLEREDGTGVAMPMEWPTQNFTISAIGFQVVRVG